jgi:hypothetical protein
VKVGLGVLVHAPGLLRLDDGDRASLLVVGDERPVRLLDEDVSHRCVRLLGRRKRGERRSVHRRIMSHSLDTLWTRYSLIGGGKAGWRRGGGGADEAAPSTVGLPERLSARADLSIATSVPARTSSLRGRACVA